MALRWHMASGHRTALPVVQVAAVFLAVPALLGEPLRAQTAFDFEPPVIYQIGSAVFPNSVEAGDLDRDGFVDLILAGRNNDGRMIILPGGPMGIFGRPLELNLGDQTNWASVADFDGDLLLDLAVSHRAGLSRVTVLRGDGSGAFEPPADFGAGRSPALLRSRDFDGDGDLDLVVFNGQSFDISVLRNRGDGSFELVQTLPINASASPSASGIWAVAADLDGDQDLDLAVSGLNSGRFFSIFFNKGDGTFHRAVQVVLPGIGPDEAVATMVAADFDGDGDIDLVTKAGGSDFIDRLLVLRNDGDGRFGSIVEVPLSPSLGGSPWDIATGDFDGDGRPDLVWVSHIISTKSVGFLRNVTTDVPAFATPEQVFFLGGFPRALRPVDVDGDGDTDIVVVNISLQSVAVLINRTPQGIPLAAKGSPQSRNSPRGRRRGAGERPAVASGPTPPPPTAERLLQWGAPGAGPGRRTGGGVRGAGGTRSSAGGGSFVECGAPEAGDCFEPHPGPGCDDTACCNATCNLDPFCCQVEWDQHCVDTATTVCEPPPVCPSEGSCVVPHETSGCEDQSCCELVCLVERGYCCDGAWDHICAHEAALLCGQPPCTLEPCPETATPEPEGETCQERVNDGCNLLTPAFTPIACGETICGTVWTHFTHDTDWYEITVALPTRLTWTVSSEFPSKILIIAGNCLDTYSVVAAAHGGGCQPASVATMVQPGTYYLFVAPGTEAAPISHGIGCFDAKGKFVEGGAFTSRYTAAVSCAPACPADIDGDGRVAVPDLLSLLSAWGTSPKGPPDLDGDGIVGRGDLEILIETWGVCP